MKFKIKYLLVLLVFPFVASSQSDTVTTTFTTIFYTKIAGLDDQVRYKNLSDFALPVENHPHYGFENNFDTLNLSVFGKRLKQATAFYQWLEELSDTQKQHLITLFFGYEDQFVTALAEAGLPEEMKYLAPALSAMNQESAGLGDRAGIWQLTHFQGVLNGLYIDRLIDERFDPILSTRAFTRQVKQNRKLFGSDELAVLAYLVGNARIRNCISEADSAENAFEFLAQLPDQVTESIAAYQAFAVFLSVNRPQIPPRLPQPDTVLIDYPLHFQQVAQVIDVPVKQLQVLNPKYRFSIVPGAVQKSCLILPQGLKEIYLANQDSICQAYDSTLFAVVAPKIEYPPAPTRQYANERVKDLEIEGKTKLYYRLKTGDVLGYIAEDFDVQVEDLKYWNNIYNERRIQAGQQIIVFVDNDKADDYKSLLGSAQNQKTSKTGTAVLRTPVAVPASATKLEHVVKNGESPYIIAKQYRGVTPEAILDWNGISDARKIQIGQKLIIYVSQ